MLTSYQYIDISHQNLRYCHQMCDNDDIDTLSYSFVAIRVFELNLNNC